MFSLTIIHRGGPPRVESFEGSEISIGRVPGNDLVLPGANISKRHARIVHNAARDTYVVIDNRSTNGTTVNGERLESPREVKRGEEIKIGDFLLSIADGVDVPVSAFDSMADEALAQLVVKAKGAVDADTQDAAPEAPAAKPAKPEAETQDEAPEVPAAKPAKREAEMQDAAPEAPAEKPAKPVAETQPAALTKKPAKPEAETQPVALTKKSAKAAAEMPVAAREAPAEKPAKPAAETQPATREAPAEKPAKPVVETRADPRGERGAAPEAETDAYLLSDEQDDDTQVPATMPIPEELRRTVELNVALAQCLRRYVEVDETYRLVAFGSACSCGSCLLCESRAALQATEPA